MSTKANLQYPSVSIVVPVYNAAQNLDQCIRSLLDVVYPQEKLEIILVDNYSSDQSAQIIKKYPVKYLFEAKKGISFARNRGIKESQHEMIAFIDSDCFVDKDWLKNLVVHLDDNQVGGVGGKIVSYQAKNFFEGHIDWSESHYCQVEQLTKENCVFPWINTSNAIFRKDVLKQLNYFDERLERFVDTDLTLRMLLEGFSMRYADDAIVSHKHRNTFVDTIKWFFSKGFYYPNLLKRHQAILKKGRSAMLAFGIQKSLMVIFKDLKELILSLLTPKQWKHLKYICFDLFAETVTILGFIAGWIRLMKDYQSIYVHKVKADVKFIAWDVGPDLDVLDFSDSKVRRYHLNSSGKKLWKWIFDEQRSVSHITQKIIRETGESQNTVQRDLHEFLGSFENRDLLPEAVRSA